MKKTPTWLRKEKKRILSIVFVMIVSIAFVFTWQFLWAQREIERVAFKQTQNLLTDKEKILALATWMQNYNFTFPGAKDPVDVFISKSGDCIGYANLYVLMANYVGLPARIVGTDGETHFWVEIFSNGSWFNLEPIGAAGFGNPRWYVDERRECESNFNKRLSYVFWIDSYGQKHEITDRYVDTKRLVIEVTENSKPTDVRIVIKSHHLMEACPNNFKTSIVVLVENTGPSGVFDKNLGPNNYTIVIERDIIPLLPSLLVYSVRKDIELKENVSTNIEFDNSNISLGENYLGAVFLGIYYFLLIVLVIVVYEITKNLFRKFQKKKIKST